MEFENGQFVVVGSVERVMAVLFQQGARYWEFVIEVEGGVLEVSDRRFDTEVEALSAGLSYWLGDRNGNE